MKFMQKEIDNFSLHWQNTIMKLKSEDEKQMKQHKFNAAIGNLEKTNRRFMGAILFSSVATIIALLQGFQEAFACAIMLFGTPLLIASVENKHHFSSDLEKVYPIPDIEKKAEFRSLFASAVWSIAISLVVALGIFSWGHR